MTSALLLVAGLMLGAGPASAQPLHHVKYTVTSEQPFHAAIYYREVDPPNFAEYSHNPYKFTPKAEVDIGPNQPWVRDVMLANPDQWALVMATSGRSDKPPHFGCQLEVDGEVVVTDEGEKGALCSIRHW